MEAKKERLRTLFVEQAISLSEYKSDIEKLNKDIELKKNKSELTENWHEQMNQLLDGIYNFEEIIKNANCSDKKQLLKLFCSNLVWDEEKLYILKADWVKTFINGRKIILQKYPMFEPKNNEKFKGLNEVLDINCPVLWTWIDNIRKKLCKKSSKK